jgi:hypothetical protein
MKTYRVVITYTGQEIYLLTAENEEEAKLKGLRYFAAQESGEVTEETRYEVPQRADVETISEVVALDNVPESTSAATHFEVN